MIDFCICLETAFDKEDRSFPDRVRMAADAGFRAVEIWDWRDKSLRDLGLALRQTGIELHTLCVEDWRDKCQLSDPASHAEFVRRVSETAAVAVDLGVPKLVVLAGDVRHDGVREVHLAAVGDALRYASDAVSMQPVELLLEVVNRQFEGPYALLQDSLSALRLLRKLGRANVRYLYDRYHSILNGEALGWAVDGNLDLIGHVQAADIPGRHEFGTGVHDWARELGWLLSAGYSGYVGIEAVVLGDGAAVLTRAQSLLGQAKALSKTTIPKSFQ